MQMREHRSIEDKHLLQPYYYRRWYCCMQRRCRTTLVMPEEHKVWNEAMLAQPEPVEPASVLRPGDDIALDMLSADDKKAPWE